MRIAIEAQRIFRINKHGMDFVALEMIRELQRIDHRNEYFILTNSGEDHCLHESENLHIITIHSPLYPVWEQICLPKAIRKIKPDILHCTSNTAPIFCHVPLILTLHDIIFLEKRQHASKSWNQNLGWYYRRFVVPKILPKCHRIITVSQYECDRIGTTLSIDKQRLIPIYNGYNPYFQPMDSSYEVTKNYLADRDYLFFLGNTDPKKNTARTLRAYALYVQRTEQPLPLLIADLQERIIDEILKEEHIQHIKPLIRCPGYISNRDLPYIYSGARVFLYTSLRESFGIPLLEAMACGTPVITSNTSAMPEIAGDGAVLVNPLNENEIADALMRLLNDASWHESQRAYGLERVTRFSWERTAREMLTVYQSML